MTTLKEIRKDAIEIGYIDQSIIDRLQEEIQADQQISLEEANFLFTIKKQFANKKNSPNWRIFFIDTITRFLLEDEDSPGVVDEQEAQWLRAYPKPRQLRSNRSTLAFRVAHAIHQLSLHSQFQKSQDSPFWAIPLWHSLYYLSGCDRFAHRLNHSICERNNQH